MIKREEYTKRKEVKYVLQTRNNQGHGDLWNVKTLNRTYYEGKK